MNRHTRQSSHFFHLCIGLLCLTVWSSSARAQDTLCTDLSPLACVTSDACMLTKDVTCQAPYDRCQLGFKQAILDASGTHIDTSQHQKTVEQCRSQAGCDYVPAEQCYCPPDVSCFCGGGAPPNCLPARAGELMPPDGLFVVVDARAASGVASPPLNGGLDNVVGQEITVSPSTLEMEGMSCAQWEIREVSPPVTLSDPLLADALLGPVEAATAPIDHRILKGWNYACEGEVFNELLEIDRRVLVLPWQNGEVHLILERPLLPHQITTLQNGLKSTKFMTQDPTGVLDEETLLGLGFWAEYRSAKKLPYRFLRTAITENLLVGLVE